MLCDVTRCCCSGGFTRDEVVMAMAKRVQQQEQEIAELRAEVRDVQQERDELQVGHTLDLEEKEKQLRVEYEGRIVLSENETSVLSNMLLSLQMQVEEASRAQAGDLLLSYGGDGPHGHLEARTRRRSSMMSGTATNVTHTTAVQSNSGGSDGVNGNVKIGVTVPGSNSQLQPLLSSSQSQSQSQLQTGESPLISPKSLQRLKRLSTNSTASARAFEVKLSPLSRPLVPRQPFQSSPVVLSSDVRLAQLDATSKDFGQGENGAETGQAYDGNETAAFVRTGAVVTEDEMAVMLPARMRSTSTGGGVVRLLQSNRRASGPTAPLSTSQSINSGSANGGSKSTSNNNGNGGAGGKQKPTRLSTSSFGSKPRKSNASASSRPLTSPTASKTTLRAV